MKILLIEDNRADARLFEIMLKQISIGRPLELTWEDTLAKGLSQLDPENSFDIILTDLALPDSFGFETLEKVREAVPPGLPVFVLTGDDDEEKAREAVERGARACISKNEIDSEKLEALLRGTLTETASPKS